MSADPTAPADLPAPGPGVRIEGITKTFGTTRVLDDVSLELAPGEVHALLGENGSGKSTLIKVLAGFHTPDRGSLEAGGERSSFPLDAAARARVSLSFVHQDLGLVPSLSVVENLAIDRLASAGGFQPIRWRAEARRAEMLLAKYGVTGIDPGQAVATLDPVQRALIAIVRAVDAMPAANERPGVLVLDEPTVFLSQSGVRQLFGLVREITARGSSVVLVSHDLDEVLEIADRVTVLRDGRRVGTRARSELDAESLIEMILGRELAAAAETTVPELPSGAPMLRVTGLSGERVRAVDFELRAGEVLGLTGLAGAGHDDVPYHLFGATSARSGRMVIESREVELAQWDPQAALTASLALIPADRRVDGVAISLDVQQNVTMQTLDRERRWWGLSPRALNGHAVRLAERFDIRPRDPGMTIGLLSGGNQQKAVLAKWLDAEPRVLLLHEPTQGVDIGAREQIFELIEEYAGAGNAVLCASSDHEQLAKICHRVIVFTRGEAVAELTGAAVTKETISETVLAGGGARQNSDR